MIEYTVKVINNRQEWFLNGKLHREDGPAIIEGNRQAWYLNGKLHREDGPAYINDEYQSWHLHGKKVTEEDVRRNNLNKRS